MILNDENYDYDDNAEITCYVWKQPSSQHGWRQEKVS